MYKGILFDFDGVILESVTLKEDGFADLYAGQTVEQIRYVRDYHNAHGGVSRFEKIRHFNTQFGLPTDPATINQMSQRFSDLILDKIKVCPLVPGALDFLQKFASKIPFIVVSATPQTELREILKLRSLETYFEDAFGSPRKKDVIVREILAARQWRPSEVLFVGDAMTDYLAAEATQIDFLGRVTDPKNDVFPCTTKKTADIFSALADLIYAPGITT